MIISHILMLSVGTMAAVTALIDRSSQNRCCEFYGGVPFGTVALYFELSSGRSGIYSSSILCVMMIAALISSIRKAAYGRRTNGSQ